MFDITTFSTRMANIVVTVAMIAAGTMVRQAVAAESGLETTHRDIQVAAMAAEPGKKYDIGLIETRAARDKLVEAIEVVYRSSPASARAIENLKQHGTINIVYSPEYPKNSPGSESMTVAAFFPGFFDHNASSPDKRVFMVIVGRYGIKWPAKELAGTLIHELAGHGIQHLEKRLSRMRELEAECEAELRQEVFFQDARFDKKSHEMINFRKSLEGHWCSDLKAHMQKNTPSMAALWDTLNPDVSRLLTALSAYVDHLKGTGIAQKARIAAASSTRDRRP